MIFKKVILIVGAIFLSLTFCACAEGDDEESDTTQYQDPTHVPPPTPQDPKLTLKNCDFKYISTQHIYFDLTFSWTETSADTFFPIQYEWERSVCNKLDDECEIRTGPSDKTEKTWSPSSAVVQWYDTYRVRAHNQFGNSEWTEPLYLDYDSALADCND